MAGLFGAIERRIEIVSTHCPVAFAADSYIGIASNTPRASHTWQRLKADYLTQINWRDGMQAYGD